MFSTCTTLLFLLLGQGAMPQVDVRSPLYFQTYSTRDGLSQNSVISMLQDRDGFMWFGTEDGLNRFDGYQFKIFRQEPGAAGQLSANVMLDLLLDDDGGLWLATDEGGVNLLDLTTGAITHFRADPDNPEGLPTDQIDSLAMDADGILWVGTQEGLVALDPASGQCRRFRSEVGNAETLPGNRIRDLAFDHRGRLWVASNGGTSVMDPDTAIFTTLDHRSARAILCEDNGFVWVGTREFGLLRLDPNGKKTVIAAGEQAEGGLSHHEVRAILRDSRGWLWVGTRNGITLFENTDERSYHYNTAGIADQHLPFNLVRTIQEDRSGLVWVGGFGGLVHCRPNHIPFQVTSSEKDGLSNNRIRSVLQDREGILWVGTADGLNRFAPGVKKPRVDLRNEDETRTGITGHIWALMEDRNGDVWIGTSRGPAWWERETDRFFNRRNVMPDHLDPTETHIRSMAEDTRGHVWLGAIGGLVEIMPNGAMRFFPGGDQEILPHPTIGTLLQGRNERLWIGTMGGGLAAMNIADKQEPAQVWRPNMDGSGPVHGKISALHEQADGTLWVGTYGGGLSRFDPAIGKFRHYTRRDGLPNLVIYAILEDPQGELWLSSNSGITRFDPATGPVRTYNYLDGLPSDEFNMGAAYALPSGKLYFGSISGLISFMPGHFVQNTYVPPLVLTGLLKNNQPITGTKPLTQMQHWQLDADDHAITFQYAGLNFIQAEKNRYAIKLDGFDTDWVYMDNRRSATYTNLDPGTYTFHAKAANNDGYWSEPKEMLTVTMPSPWFRSPTAYLLYATLFFLAALYVAVTQRRLAWNNRELERRIADRTLELDLRNAELAEKNNELAHAYEELKMAGLSDPLTGLGNRRFLFQSIEKEISALNRIYRRAAEGDVPAPKDAFLGIFMISLDFFMGLSDRHSYQNDDQVLIEFSRLLEKVCRDSDWLIRWSGAEFLVLTRRTEVNGLAALAQRLQDDIGNHTFTPTDGDEMVLHCSIGFTSYPFSPEAPRALSWEPTLQIADLAMHAAAQSGSDTWIGLHAKGNPAGWIDHLFSDPYPLIQQKQVVLETSLPDISELVWPKPAVIK